ncbi:amino acid ABC transporter permease [Paenibacillus hodogayensis]|uniref:Amino acid ABC transporter permease n=1 Tax=Paenibacillus hodogayensis TaxID=279208 RepID=A0ABV5W237_9BACL
MDWTIVKNIFPDLLHGAGTTFLISILSIVLGTLAGFLLSLMRLSHVKALKAIAFFYTWLFRGLPLLVILFLVYYAAPFGLKLSAFYAGLLGMSLNAAAYKAEIIRSGLLAIPKGQIEAAEAVGMNPWQMMWQIRIPQTTRIILPIYISNSIALLKGSAQLSVITVPDLMLRAQTHYSSTYMPLETLGTASLLYLIMTSAMMAVQAWSEKKLKITQKLT